VAEVIHQKFGSYITRQRYETF